MLLTDIGSLMLDFFTGGEGVNLWEREKRERGREKDIYIYIERGFAFSLLPLSKILKRFKMIYSAQKSE